MIDYLQKKNANANLFSEEELRAIEEANSDGLTSGEVIDAFVAKGTKFSEATFRKYVQLGLLPRSRRVGTKGKHKGSKGIYPAVTIRQINEIKRLMALDYTIEDIRRHFAFIGGELEDLRVVLGSIFEKLEESLKREETNSILGASLRKTMDEARDASGSLIDQLENSAKRIREQARISREAV